MKQYRLAAAVALVGLVLSGCDSKPKVELESPAQKASYGIGLNMGKASTTWIPRPLPWVSRTPSARRTRS